LIEEASGFGRAVVLEQELMVVDEAVDVSRIHLEAELVGLFGGGGVAVVAEEIAVGTGHMGVVFAEFIAV
jgi:hypothetical protein